jgi:hypothetical protein
MIEFAKLPFDERVVYFQETANRLGLTRLIVEKDFWVCFTLRLLFSLEEIKNSIVFKGGTSLSKVFGIIKRFSEDIDISIEPDWLGFGGKKRPDNAPSKTQIEKNKKKLKTECDFAIKNKIKPLLEQAIQDILGKPNDINKYLKFEIDEQTQSPNIIFNYPTLEKNIPGPIKPQIKFEFGSLTNQIPIGQHSVKPLVAEEFPDNFKEPTCQVISLEAERTFWEKATILHAEYHRPENKPLNKRILRDCYDIYCLSQHETGKRALMDFKLLNNVVNHKRIYFSSSWANYESAKPGTFHLVPPDYRIKEMKTIYQEMKEIFFEEPPDINILINQLKKIENYINKI